jgi:phospholipid/cholesterol/gamma-HCH transport system substrate-binding protein
VTRAIKTHATDFAAIVVLLVLAILVAGYILQHEGFRFPFIQSSPFTINAEFSTAQAVTPGQGQSVRISGVQVGTIGGVKLENGIAVVQLNIDSKYKNLIHTNWTALLRPRTGLKDMFVELAPGPGSAPLAKPGYTIPVANTNPDIDVDEILGSLDADSRSYLNLLINGAGQGLSGKGGSELAQVLERFEPTHRDLARVNGAIAVRGADLRQLVNSLQRLNTALAKNSGQISQLVVSSAKVFHAFASEDGNISKALVDLPGTLSQTTKTLNQVTTFAKLLGPTSAHLLPAARSLPAANAALTALAVPSTPIVKNQIRPFVIAARPLVQQLEPAAQNLNKATPNLSSTFGVINHLANMLGYSPGGAQHGYLWWLAWLDHNIRTLFSVQDANGVYRPLFLQASCASLNQIAQGVSGSALLLNLTPILSDTGLCPTTTATGPLPIPLSKKGASSSSKSSAAGSAGSGSSSRSRWRSRSRSRSGSSRSGNAAGTSSTSTRSAAPSSAGGTSSSSSATSTSSAPSSTTQSGTTSSSTSTGILPNLPPLTTSTLGH